MWLKWGQSPNYSNVPSSISYTLLEKKCQKGTHLCCVNVDGIEVCWHQSTQHEKKTNQTSTRKKEGWRIFTLVNSYCQRHWDQTRIFKLKGHFIGTLWSPGSALLGRIWKSSSIQHSFSEYNQTLLIHIDQHPPLPLDSPAGWIRKHTLHKKKKPPKDSGSLNGFCLLSLMHRLAVIIFRVLQHASKCPTVYFMRHVVSVIQALIMAFAITFLLGSEVQLPREWSEWLISKQRI